MSMTLLIILNILMSILAFAAVGVGVVIARRLDPQTDSGGRADGRGLLIPAAP